MSQPVAIRFADTDLAGLAKARGLVAAIVPPEGRAGAVLRLLNRLTRGAVTRAMEGDAWAKIKPGDAIEITWPAGMECERLLLVALPQRATLAEARKAGATVGKALHKDGTTVVAGTHARAADLAFGLSLRAYDFAVYKSEAAKVPGPVTMMVAKPENVARHAKPMAALAEGVFFTRDLVNEPANVLTTYDFAARLAAMQDLGLDVEILEEEDLEKLGMRALLGVGQGSESPSKVVVMQWHGGDKGAAPLALVGKGVVFDTGGISIKPAAGMEEMTMDMGGAGVVAGVMRTLALRRARANVVGLVGLVENMPDGRAQRPGDIVRSMKGDTIEVINTDAEGRLVLADVLWYAQERFKPRGIVDLATLTGAIIIGLGHENAGVFSNDDGFRDAFLAAAKAEGEGAWPMPMGEAYDRQIKSRLADMKNVGGRPAGAVTAAQFIRRFIKDGMPWIHLDIAGVALPPEAPVLAPKGASGWGVLALDRMIRDMLEKG